LHVQRFFSFACLIAALMQNWYHTYIIIHVSSFKSINSGCWPMPICYRKLINYGFDDGNSWKDALQGYNNPASYLNFSLLLFCFLPNR